MITRAPPDRPFGDRLEPYRERVNRRLERAISGGGTRDSGVGAVQRVRSPRGRRGGGGTADSGVGTAHAGRPEWRRRGGGTAELRRIDPADHGGGTADSGVGTAALGGGTRYSGGGTRDSGDSIPERLRAAMEYSVLGAGKRVRPLLAYACGELAGIAAESVDAIAASVELIHSYSLIHDDLPAMDDDDLRRGRPTTHRRFDVATAILAGDALQALAFETLSTDEALAAHPAAARLEVVAWLASAAGPAGMVGGQSLDMEAEGRRVGETALEKIHRMKTGALLRASIMMPSVLGAMSEAERDRLDAFARDIGLVFQIRDDLLEVEQDTATLGKSAGSDRANEKSTYASVLGADGAQARADELYGRAKAMLDSLGPGAEGLAWLADFILRRSH